MTRLAAVLALLAVLVIPASALADDALAAYLESAMEADYHGSGVVMSVWGGDSAAAEYEVTRAAGMAMVSGPEGSMMAEGGVTASSTGTDWFALELSTWSDWAMSQRYRIGGLQPVERLGRSATELSVFEGDRLRARIIVDDATAAPLLTEVFDGDGDMYRMAAMVEFDPNVAEMPHMPEETVSHDMVMLVERSPRLPDAAFGYLRSDTYGMGETTSQSFYSDGLFSFSVFEAGRGGVPADFADATVFEMGGSLYRRIVSPSQVWVEWNSPEHTYVLVGDLPPDHLEAVLASLPRPGTRGVVMRLLSRLFG